MAPSRYGPTKPPVFPTAFTSAMAAAAPVPRIVAVASAQNGPNIEARPSMATDSMATVHAAPDPSGVRHRPAALTTAGTSTC